ncbi:hypothetical protein OS493_008351 [Desmophyllum pertusum]|uniref:Uncharacterized protein n=1 Tax=Desmophyllum pertusum TaxID=174260 RepID=A0A9X0A4R5_9CNID|nr:hypothetical protein OS493_008351 [Desmophyllum pertusum]
MHRVRISVMLILAVTFLAMSLVKGDTAAEYNCSHCCRGKWSQCMSGCVDFNTCDAHCSTEKQSCDIGCPGSCSVNDPPYFRNASVKRQVSRPKKLKLRRKLKKQLKRAGRKH